MILLCPFCESSNIEVLNIEIAGNPLYVYETLVEKCIKNNERMFQINIEKENSETIFTPAGSQEMELGFIKASLKKVAEILDQRHESLFKAYPSGNFFICITGVINLYSPDSNLIVQRFHTVGLSKDEITNSINSFFEKAGIKI